MQEEIIKALGLKIGDTVRIIGKINSPSLGWNLGWTFNMTRCINQIGIITDIRSNGVFVKIPGYITYNYPAHCLEPFGKVIKVKLNDDYEAEVTKDGIMVGCQKIPLSVVKELAEAIENL